MRFIVSVAQACSFNYSELVERLYSSIHRGTVLFGYLSLLPKQYHTCSSSTNRLNFCQLCHFWIAIAYLAWLLIKTSQIFQTMRGTRSLSLDLVLLDHFSNDQTGLTRTLGLALQTVAGKLLRRLIVGTANC